MLDADTVRFLINEVVDPCSASIGVPIGLVDLGLVRSVSVGGGPDHPEVFVSLRLTSPGCTFAHEFSRSIQQRLEAEGAAEVTVSCDAIFDWTPEDVAEQARARLRKETRR